VYGSVNALEEHLFHGSVDVYERHQMTIFELLQVLNINF